MQYERDILLENWRTTEAALCMKSPVCEVEFAHDDRTALSLYDCLVPKLREQRRLNLGKDYQLTVSDIRVQQHVMQLEYNLAQKNVPKLKEEITKLRKQVEVYEQNLEVVDWYNAVMEKGVDTKDTVEQYVKL